MTNTQKIKQEIRQGFYDCFAGTGIVLQTARELGRAFVGIDKNLVEM